jgi:hypothetical protein
VGTIGAMGEPAVVEHQSSLTIKFRLGPRLLARIERMRREDALTRAETICALLHEALRRKKHRIAAEAVEWPGRSVFGYHGPPDGPTRHVFSRITRVCRRKWARVSSFDAEPSDARVIRIGELRESLRALFQRDHQLITSSRRNCRQARRAPAVAVRKGMAGPLPLLVSRGPGDHLGPVSKSWDGQEARCQRPDEGLPGTAGRAPWGIRF